MAGLSVVSSEPSSPSRRHQPREKGSREKMAGVILAAHALNPMRRDLDGGGSMNWRMADYLRRGLLASSSKTLAMRGRTGGMSS